MVDASDATTYAAIDIGTNSILLLIAKRPPAEPGTLVPLIDQAKTVRLGENLISTGTLTAKAMERTLTGIQGYLELLQPFTPVQITCFGTEALRRASNSHQFHQQLRQQLGLDLQILSPKEEAYYTFKGALSSLTQTQQGPALVIDIGGGSTEIVYGTADSIEYQQSFPIGAIVTQDKLQLGEKISAPDISRIQSHIKNHVEPLPSISPDTVILLTGGTATTIAALDQRLSSYDIAAIDGHPMTSATIQALFHQLNHLSLEQRAALPGMEPGRADIILSAMAILLTLLTDLNADTVKITVRGARYGLLL